MSPAGCQYTKIGELNGLRITAATDAAGPQVIVRGNNLHLLSQPLANHEAAITLGENVLQNGIDSYDKWIDLNKNPYAAFVLGCMNFVQDEKHGTRRTCKT